jgi:hypothetical protein
MTRDEYHAQQAAIPGTWQNRQGRELVDDGLTEEGVPGTGIVLALIVTVMAVGFGMLLADVWTAVSSLWSGQ